MGSFSTLSASACVALDAPSGSRVEVDLYETGAGSRFGDQEAKLPQPHCELNTAGEL